LAELRWLTSLFDRATPIREVHAGFLVRTYSQKD
jgi:hypothetical protein